MSNQASEALEAKLNTVIFARFYDIPDSQRSTVVKNLQALIRTEKLKLLDEVVHQSTVNLKSAKAVAGWAELRKKQLEAEL